MVLVVISLFVFRLARQRTLFRKREYTRIAKLTLILSFLYMLPALYIGWITTDSGGGYIMLLEWVVDSAVSANSGGCPVILSMLIHLQIGCVVVSLNFIATVLS